MRYSYDICDMIFNRGLYEKVSTNVMCGTDKDNFKFGLRIMIIE